MVRQYAVETLQSSSDEELFLYLLQLVQALRYEPEPAPAHGNNICCRYEVIQLLKIGLL
jgi:hypothetical protein